MFLRAHSFWFVPISCVGFVKAEYFTECNRWCFMTCRSRAVCTIDPVALDRLDVDNANPTRPCRHHSFGVRCLLVSCRVRQAHPQPLAQRVLQVPRPQRQGARTSPHAQQVSSVARAQVDFFFPCLLGDLTGAVRVWKRTPWRREG